MYKRHNLILSMKYFADRWHFYLDIYFKKSNKIIFLTKTEVTPSENHL